jgi:polysaccharide lyase-like protein
MRGQARHEREVSGASGGIPRQRYGRLPEGRATCLPTHQRVAVNQSRSRGAFSIIGKLATVRSVARPAVALGLCALTLQLAAAASGAVSWRGDFETGDLSQWSGTRAPEGAISVAQAPTTQGRYATRFQTREGICLSIDKASDGSCKRYHSQLVRQSNETPGTESWWGMSLYWPEGFRADTSVFNSYGGWHPRSGTMPCQANVHGATIVRGSTGPDYPIEARIHGGPSCADDVVRTLPLGRITVGRWMRFVYHIVWSSNPDVALIEIWVNGTKQASVRTPTLYAYLPSGRYDVYFKHGVYHGRKGAGQIFYVDNVLRGSSFGDVAGGVAPDPTPELSVATTGLDAGQTVSGPVQWEATTAGASVDYVDFLVDGSPRWTDSSSPYLFGGSSGWDTALVENGEHTFTARAVAVDGRAATSSVTVNVENEGSSPPPAESVFQVAVPGLEEGQTVSGNVRWEAVPAGAATEQVAFLIDGRLRWTERSTPYVFNGNSGTWQTAGEPAGAHTLTVRAMATDGRKTTTSVRVLVAGPVSFKQAPRLLSTRSVAASVGAPAGSRVVLTIRGPQGSVLGKRKLRAGQDGTARGRVRLSGWLGHRPLTAIVSNASGTDRVRVAMPRVAFVSRPSVAGAHTLLVRASALPGRRIKIVIRSASGRVLGLARARASRSGRVRQVVSLPLWHGQERLAATIAASGARKNLGLKLGPRELRRLRG